MTQDASPRILALVLGTAALAAVAIAVTWTGPPGKEFWFWLGACLLGEVLWVRLPVGRATVSMASCFHFAALLVLPRGQVMAVAALSGLLAEYAFMRKPPIRAVFNGAQVALAVGAASWAIAVVGGPSANVPNAFAHASPVALLVGAALYFILNTGAVSWAVGLCEGISLLTVWRANFGTRYELLSSGALFSLGAMMAAYYLTAGMSGTIFVVLPLLIAHEGYRRYAIARLEGVEVLREAA